MTTVDFIEELLCYEDDELTQQNTTRNRLKPSAIRLKWILLRGYCRLFKTG